MSTSSQAEGQPAAKLNMRTIAKKAGVSATTVSLALRDDPSISVATKERIRSIQQALGYRVNGRRERRNSERASALEVLTYKVVGIDMREENYAPFLYGVGEECRKRSIKLELECSLDADFEMRPPIPRGGQDGVNRGLILTGLLEDRHIEAVRAAGVPFVVLGNYSFSTPVHMAGIDLMGAACTILGDLAGEGMKSLAIVVEDRHAAFERSFIRYIRGAFLDMGYSMGQELIVEVGLGFCKTGDAAEKILRHYKPGMIVLCLEHHCAQHLVMELHTRQATAAARIPIVSFGDAGNCRTRSRHFRVFDFGKDICARMAVVRAAELFRDPATPPFTSIIQGPGWI